MATLKVSVSETDIADALEEALARPGSPREVLCPLARALQRDRPAARVFTYSWHLAPTKRNEKPTPGVALTAGAIAFVKAFDAKVVEERDVRAAEAAGKTPTRRVAMPGPATFTLPVPV